MPRGATPSEREGRGGGATTVAALYVETGGCYFDLPGVDPWAAYKDARCYVGPWPVVAHPPCQRWGRFWHGSTRKPHQFRFGDDDGCFAAALASVRQWGGVLEHPADSGAPAVLAAFGEQNVGRLWSIPGTIVTDWLTPPAPKPLRGERGSHACPIARGGGRDHG